MSTDTLPAIFSTLERDGFVPILRADEHGYVATLRIGKGFQCQRRESSAAAALLAARDVIDAYANEKASAGAEDHLNQEFSGETQAVALAMWLVTKAMPPRTTMTDALIYRQARAVMIAAGFRQGGEDTRR